MCAACLFLDFLPLLFPSTNPPSMLTLSPGQTAGILLFLSPTKHTLTLSRSGQDDSLISFLDPPPAPFSLHSPPFAELPPYRGVCVGVDEGSFCSVQEHLHQWKRVSQGLPVSPSPSWHSTCSHPSSPNASRFIRDNSSRTGCSR